MGAVRDHKWTSVAACRDMGKSRLAAYLALWFLITRPDSLVFTIAPTWQQIEEALWAEIRGIWQDSLLPRLFPQWEVMQTSIKTTNPRWRAIGVTSKDVQNIEGRHGDSVLVIMDESKGIQDEFFNSVQGMLTQEHSKLLAIGTPGVPSGWFARSFSTDRSLWGAHYKIRGDNPKIPRLNEKFEHERKRLGDNNPWFRQQQCAEFAGADEFSLLPIDKVEAAINRNPLRDVPELDRAAVKATWPRILALDPAGKGSDDSVLTYRHGPLIVKQRSWNGWDEMRTAAETAKEAIEWRASKVAVDEIGIGAGIRSRVKQLLAETNIAVIGFNAGRAPKRTDRYMNKKTEECFKLRELFMSDQISIPNDPKLIEQLCSWRTDFTASGKTKVVDPDDSPDRADSLLIAFAAESAGQSVRQISPSWL